MNGKLVYGQISYSTADVEEDQFAGEVEPTSSLSYLMASDVPLPPGEYRVIDGELFQLIDSRPENGSEEHGPDPNA